MVIETLIKPEWVEKSPIYALPLGFCLSIIGLAVGLILFPEDVSLVGLLFTTLAALPFLRKIIWLQEKQDERINSFVRLILRNRKIIEIYVMFFFGVALSYFLLYFVLPDILVQTLFEKQLEIFSQKVLGGFFKHTSLFRTIVLNNIKILIICLVLSFLYGAGAIMVLTWNASALGIFLATLGKAHSVLLTLPHAFLEFTGFFFASVGGGVISVAISRGEFKSKQFKQILSDGLLLFLFGVLIVILAAIVEVTIGTLA